MAQVIRLTREHEDSIMELFKLRQSYMQLHQDEAFYAFQTGLPSDNTGLDFENHMRKDIREKYLPHSELFQLYGYVEGKDVISVVGMRFQEKFPAWVLTKMISRPDLGFHNNGLPEVFNYCIEQAENKGIGEYLTCVPLNLMKAHDRVWSSKVPLRKRYEIYTDEIVPAGMKPLFALHFLLMAGVAWPVDLIIRRHMLKEEYRSSIFEKRRANFFEQLRRWHPNPEALLDKFKI